MRVFLSNGHIVDRVTAYLEDNGIKAPDFTVAQYAAALSLYKASSPEIARFEAKGASRREMQEYYLDAFEGDLHPLRIAFSVRDGVNYDAEVWSKTLAKYIDFGLELMADVLDKQASDQFALLRYLGDVLYQEDSDRGVAKRIDVLLGKEGRELQPLKWSINREGGDQDSAHLAIAGKTGVGKTQLLISLVDDALRSAPGLGCIIFDYKGDISTNHSKLLQDLQFTTLTVGQEPIPINPLVVPDTASKEAHAQGFAEVTQVYRARMGDVQVAKIRNALLEAYAKVGTGNDVSFDDVRSAFVDLHGAKTAGDYDLLRQLSEFKLFDTADAFTVTDFLRDRWVIDLSKQAAFRDLVAFIVLYSIVQAGTELGDSSVFEGEDGDRYREMRSILVIDEAHFYLKRKVQVLQQLVRIGRSKGIAVWMSSQGLQDYEDKDRVFRQNMGRWAIFKLGESPSAKVLEAMLGIRSERARSLPNRINQLQNGHFVTSIDGDVLEVEAEAIWRRETTRS